jgi:3-oxoacyl-[acyl-carrier protein] reductase
MAALTGKVAVVTGASKGIGAGIAKRLGAAGAAVVANYASSREGAERVVAEIVSAGGKAIAVQGDVSKAPDVQRLFAETIRAFGRLDVLVNNAGVFRFQPLEEVTEAEFHRQFDINVLGPLLTTREAVKHFRGGGSVINVSSVASTAPVPNSAIYSSTKGAVDTLTQALAVELGPRGIRVNAVNPGFTETEGVIDMDVVIGTDFERQLVADTPLGRSGKPEDIAPAVEYLASDAAAWVTGETLRVSGGLR